MAVETEIETDKMLQSSMNAHPSRDGRAALRCALGDAAGVCDRMVETIKQEHRGRNGKGAITKLGMQLAAIAKRCGDEIWSYRDKVNFPTGEPTDTGKFTQKQADDMWRALNEIGFADFADGNPPDNIRQHARDAVSK